MSDQREAEYQDWKITLPFSVPAGDHEGVLTEAIFEAALHHAPSESDGLVASANTEQGKVSIVFTLLNSSRGFADEVAKSMRARIHETVFSSDESCVSAT